MTQRAIIPKDPAPDRSNATVSNATPGDELEHAHYTTSVCSRAKLILLCVVIAAILYVLISPLPELAATTLKLPIFSLILVVVLVIGFAISFLPDISMAGHIGGIIGGVLTAVPIKLPRNES